MSDDSKAAMAKASFSWGGVGISKFLAMLGIASWSDAAAMLAALYSLFLIVDWIAKKLRKSGK